MAQEKAHENEQVVLSYDNIHLPQSVSDILQQDIWLSDSFPLKMFQTNIDPVKFSASAAIFVRRGECVAELNLLKYHIKAPSIVVIRQGQILMPISASSDFNASYIVMSRKLTDRIYSHIRSTPVYATINRHPVVEMDPRLMIHFSALHLNLQAILNEAANPYAYESVVHTILAFFYRYGHLPYDELKKEVPNVQGRLVDSFIKLVQVNYKQERFLDFYAGKLGITPKHLSRVVKQQTGISAVAWIERHVVLEAQVMLRSSNLNIQQISDELHFKSQSFFGKYFKKATGVSPKQFRNSRQ